ncbi:hypothetical protein [Specibacter sp. RAF43]|uniref:hypothetical protein n=1 Tax=Specibacter sp. RAF43 TaxID=3233057 RepID=UPI003F9890E3
MATTAQLLDAGFGDRILTRAVQQRLVFRLRRGAYVRVSVWAALKPWEQTRMRLLAHILTSSGHPTYSHYSAARLHQLHVWNCGAKVHLTTPTTPSGVGVAQDVTHHHLPLDDRDVVPFTLSNHRQVFATSLERTVVDCARFGGFAQAVVIGDHALSKGASLQVMRGMVAALHGQRGVKKARRVLASLSGLSESAGESRTRIFLSGMDIPQPVQQHQIEANGTKYRADFAWPGLKLILEFDGKSKYFDFRPAKDVLLAERRRENRLIELGWRFIRIEWDDLDRPAQLERRIHAAVAAARAAVAA